MPVKYDWGMLEGEYRAGGKSLYALAKSHSVPYSTMKKYAQKNGWKNDNTGNAGESMKSLDMSKELRIADRLSDIINSALDDERQFHRYIIKNRDGTEELILNKIDMHAVSDAVRALKTIEGIKRSIAGIAQAEESPEAIDEAGIIEIPEVNEEGYDE